LYVAGPGTATSGGERNGGGSRGIPAFSEDRETRRAGKDVADERLNYLVEGDPDDDRHRDRRGVREK